MLKGIELNAAIAAVKEMARENYSNGYGYQVIFEAMDDADIGAEIEACANQKEALAVMVHYAEQMVDRAQQAVAEVF